jgi:hypothetical protein
MNRFQTRWTILSAFLLALVGSTAAAFAQTAGAAPPPTGAPAPAGQGRGQGGRGQAPVVIGPSAPVPPQVAMLRPSAAELTQINDALRRLIDADRSDSRALLKKTNRC